MVAEAADPVFIDVAGAPIAVRHRPGRTPGLAWLGGYRSDMKGTKAEALSQWAQENGRACVRFDYSGHGESGGDFLDGTIGRWLEEALAVFLSECRGPQVVIGSSMGGWLALLAAQKRPERVKAVVDIAAAPDFTDWGITPEERESLVATSRFERPGHDGGPPQVTHARFVASGTALRLLNKPIMLDCAVRLVHGDKDEEVPIGVAFKLLEDAHSGDVQLTIIKWGDHRLSKPHEIATIVRAIVELAEKIT